MALNEEQEDTTIYVVVVNYEEQYSIWPKRKDIPAGWRAVGKEGLKPECLQYIDEVWTDMRPLSLRKRMAEQAEAQSREAQAGKPRARKTGATESQATVIMQAERREQGRDAKPAKGSKPSSTRKKGDKAQNRPRV